MILSLRCAVSITMASSRGRDRADRLADLETVDIGQHEVEQDAVGTVLRASAIASVPLVAVKRS